MRRRGASDGLLSEYLREIRPIGHLDLDLSTHSAGGAAPILSAFPEPSFAARTKSRRSLRIDDVAQQRFSQILGTYAAPAKAVSSGF